MTERERNVTLRDTPRTDTAASLIKFAVVGEPYELVTAEFARVLERELARCSEAHLALAAMVPGGVGTENGMLQSATTSASQWRKVDSTTPHKNEPLIVMTDSGHVCEADNYCGHWNMPRAYQDDMPVWWMLCPGEPK